MELIDIRREAGLSHVSDSTVMRALHEQGIKAYREEFKFILKDENMAIRKKYCEERKDWSVEKEWENHQRQAQRPVTKHQGRRRKETLAEPRQINRRGHQWLEHQEDHQEDRQEARPPRPRLIRGITMIARKKKNASLVS